MKHRLAILGIGAVAEAIAQAIEATPSVVLAAGSCRTEAKGRAFAQKHGCKWYASTEALLASERPDVAIIATPSGQHLEQLTLCAKHRVHVLCEKPLEISTDRIRQMIRAAKEAGIMLGGIFPQRFNPVMSVLHQAASQGRFGSLAMIAGQVPWWRDDAYYGPGRWQGTQAVDGGGAMMNQAIHVVDLIQWLAAAAMPDLPAGANPVAEVFAFTGRRSHDPRAMEVEDTAVALLRFRNGALGQILAATSMYPGSLRRLVIAGRDGTAELHEDQLTQFHFRSRQPSDDEAVARFSATTAHAGGSSDPMAFNYTNHQRNLAAFLEALEQGRKPSLDAEESSKAVAIIEACYQSAASGQPVRL